MIPEVINKMKFYDALTLSYKKIQEGNLNVYIETDNSKRFHITTKDHHISIHNFESREKAVEFCRFLGIKIIAFINHKI